MGRQLTDDIPDRFTLMRERWFTLVVEFLTTKELQNQGEVSCLKPIKIGATNSVKARPLFSGSLCLFPRYLSSSKHCTNG